jgi:hypothetical protein
MMETEVVLYVTPCRLVYTAVSEKLAATILRLVQENYTEDGGSKRL